MPAGEYVYHMVYWFHTRHSSIAPGKAATTGSQRGP